MLLLSFDLDSAYISKNRWLLGMSGNQFMKILIRAGFIMDEPLSLQSRLSYKNCSIINKEQGENFVRIKLSFILT